MNKKYQKNQCVMYALNYLFKESHAHVVQYIGTNANLVI